MPLLETRGAASAQGFGFAQSAAPNYIEDVFSTWLYTGTGASNAIPNGIDLAGKGGLVWIKQRNAVIEHFLYDTNRGPLNVLESNSTVAAYTASNTLTSFNAGGFTLGSSNFVNGTTSAPRNYVSWTFRDQAKFFDVVTYTGDGVAGRTVAHNLGSVPGCIIVKRTDTTSDWKVYHRSIGNTQFLRLNSTDLASSSTFQWNNTSPTSTVFSLGTDGGVNGSGGTFVAYLFAHNAGGFGLTGTDNVISCGSFTVSSNVATVTLGYEPQWTMMKRTDSTDSWRINDVMRGSATEGGQNASLAPNTSDAETTGTAGTHPTATGFTVQGVADGTYIYIAIRRGPMKVPTTGTSVFAPVARTGTSGTATVTAGFPVDMAIIQDRPNAYFACWFDRLRGAPRILFSQTTNAESGSYPNSLTGFDVQTGVRLSVDAYVNSSADTYANWFFRRAPGFFDEVCYTGTTLNLTLAHNLQARPELMIIKQRSSASGWAVFSDLTSTNMRFGRLDTTSAMASDTYTNQGFLTSQPTSSSFTLIGASGQLTNNPDSTYVAYLFASAPGVSKVGSYTGNGTTQAIACGFTGGARFVLIKATSTTGDWYVWDSARGIVAGNDPYLLLNSVAAEVTGTDWVDTAATGFELSNAGGNLANSNGVSYIFLAIA